MTTAINEIGKTLKRQRLLVPLTLRELAATMQVRNKTGRGVLGKSW